ncbi:MULTISPECIES: Xaa-Pro peptidase family protein [Methanoculleus]|jgi:Xaa-Pro dipeptidase|uniref:Xaa-Pro aminopeptidase n=1 Tax=Methanoculleus thermophilus TaxID=2200 RepID=A0A1G8XX57_9EURY|nr:MULTISPECIES: Xaa-Pro peptidase family protein [Methanoculleus]NLN09239.1 aminopeptidase P family protein [Methanoculleus thermophilus]SDJ95189.1 Xaa-Pro aminopeptidase [Methanoculleus thermophilus]HQD26343.1 Xaa-Pro peptidase family protein [Methanoculleus thermophilus]
MECKTPASELRNRMERFRDRMDAENPLWEFAAIFGRVNQFYFTGTMQDAVLLIPRGDEAVLWVRRSYERALDESLFSEIRPMRSFRDAAAGMGACPATVHVETEVVPLALLERFRKHFPFHEVKPLDAQAAAVRARKSAYELAIMEQAGKIHRRVLEDCVPAMLAEGLSEAELGGEVYSLLVREGHHGIARFGMFGTEMVLGQLGFGENSIYPTSFDGPGGSRGMAPGAPVLGSRERKLKPGDLVFLDCACGVQGYHTDKTMTYVFRGSLPREAIEAHHRCVEIQNEAAAMLRPGITPEEIYDTIIGSLEPAFLENFMGYGERRVQFLGHGIGLVVDEMPVIARGFHEPLEEGMVIALEPKKGIRGVGMVGVENTFVVTRGGGRCITGTNPGLIPVE